MSSEKRVKALVWTALMGAFNMGLLTSYEANNYKIVKWFKTNNESCELCKMMNGILFNVEQAKNLLPFHPYDSCIWVIGE